MKQNQSSRRIFLRRCLAMPATFVLAACAGSTANSPAPAATTQPLAPASAPPAPTQPAPTSTEAVAQTQPTSAPAIPSQSAQATALPVAALPPTPACGDDDDDITPAQTEGPYYTPNTPERASLLDPGMAGTKLVVAGQVLSTDCQPVARALLDFWQADDAGQYDNAGYTLRGHQFADDQGRYQLETIVPGLYPGRTRHIHVKVQAPNQPVLTSQLYFPDEPSNSNDGIFQPELVMDVQDAAEGKAGRFNFVLEIQ
jgi:protocatechuate 3,4-dioxygenase beta subunit